jgi:hypothetical protein
MNDKTRIRIKVPAHLYESVKKRLTLKEGASNFSGGAYTETVKEKKTPSSNPKVEGIKSSSPKEEGKEKTVEERIATLESLMKEMIREKKAVKKESEKDQSYEAGKQDQPIEEDDSEESSKEEEKK